MKKIYLTLFCLVVYSVIYSQDNVPYIGIADVYGLKVEIVDQALNAKCPCSMIKSDKHSACSLYKVVVKNVLIQRDTSVYTRDELLEIRYLVIKNEAKVETKKEYIILCKNSSSKKYLIANSLVQNDTYDLSYSLTLAYMSGLHSCYSPNFWQKLRLFFSFKRQKKRRRLEEKLAKKDPFLKYIEK